MRSRALTCALLIALAVAAATASGAGAAGSTTVVSASVPSATSLDASGCAPATAGVTELGSVQPGATAVTSADCTLAWGSSNDSSMLRAFQSDGVGTAMGGPPVTWAAKTVRDGSEFAGIAAESASVAYVAASSSGVLVTTNGGTTWTWVDPFPQYLNAVSIAPGSPGVAYAVGAGGTIFRSADSGTTWPAETSPTTSSLQAVSMVDDGNGFAVGSGGTVVRRTTAGGATWAAMTSPAATTLSGVSAVSSSVAWVAGASGVLRRTADGGSIWAAPTTTCWGSYRGIAARDDATAYAVGLGGLVTKLTWNAATNTLTCTVLEGLGEDLNAVVALPAPSETVYVAGALGTLMRSTDGGVSWSRLRPGTSAGLAGVAAPTDGSLWTAGSSGTVTRAPTGTTWAVVRSETAISTTYTDIAAVDALRAYTVGGQVDGGGTWRAALRTTVDGGTTWTDHNSGTTNALFGVSSSGSSVAVAVGDDGTVVRTSDAGATWTAQGVAPGVRLWDVDLADDRVAWAVGDAGTIIKTTDGGATWSAQASPVTTGLRGVSAVGKDVAFAAGTNGRILRTLDGGTTWTSLAGGPTGSSYDDISAADANTVWLVWGWQSVGRTSNASAATPTWTTSSTGSGMDNFSIDAVSRDTAWIGAAWGARSHTVDGGATWTTYNILSHGYGIDGVDENTAWSSGNDSGIHRATSNPAADIPDYDDVGPNWSSTSSLFAACLRDSTGTNVTPTWTVDAGCAPSGTGVWRGIPASSAAAGAKVAGATAATTATARLRFGMKVGSSQAPGRYSAGVTFEVIAPNA